MHRLTRNTPPRWPFWLLIAAWVCANSPQVTTYAVLNWLAEARHFSHQRHLMAEVASVLAGESPSTEVTECPVASSKPLPAIPTEAVLKKIEMAFEDVATKLPPALRSETRRPGDAQPPEPRTEPPLHEPPRSAIQV